MTIYQVMCTEDDGEVTDTYAIETCLHESRAEYLCNSERKDYLEEKKLSALCNECPCLCAKTEEEMIYLKSTNYCEHFADVYWSDDYKSCLCHFERSYCPEKFYWVEPIEVDENR